jgi:polysaccharide biosynthesis/export protein
MLHRGMDTHSWRLCAPLAGLLASLGLAALGLAADVPDPDARRLIQLGPGDSVTVEVYGQPDMTTTVYVGDDGTISLPLVGAVPVSGLSPVDAGKRTEQALKTGGFLNDPHVTISVVQSRSQRVAVLGEVHTPGRYTIDPNATILDLLAQAGGATADAADFAYVLRPDAHGNVNRFVVEFGGLPGQSAAHATPTLLGGDSLYVPRAQQYYIYGEVTAPNKYRLEPGMTVLQAIARAGGITPRGSERRVEIKRAAKDGSYEVIRPKPSDLILPDDVIRVKESIF